MRVDDFDFDLPPELIAQRPAIPRDASRLLVVADGALKDRLLQDLPSLLHPGDVLVVNNTKVLRARLVGMRGTAKIEATLHKRVGDGEWLAFAKPSRRLNVGDVVNWSGPFTSRVVSKGERGEVQLKFDRSESELETLLEEYGSVPLPPYIKRIPSDTTSDTTDYQTIFASSVGAVAAPTAGLHFTSDLMRQLEARGVRRAELTLHVGAGTFLPVTVEHIEQHIMHSEWGQIDEITADLINSARRDGRRIVAVGTTSLRLLESAADGDGRIRPFRGETQIFITPGYQFRTADILLTNFHLPRSTLFMLVCAFAGFEAMKLAYKHAVEQRYRFYSYGDACLLFRR